VLPSQSILVTDSPQNPWKNRLKIPNHEKSDTSGLMIFCPKKIKKTSWCSVMTTSQNHVICMFAGLLANHDRAHSHKYTLSHTLYVTDIIISCTNILSLTLCHSLFISLSEKPLLRCSILPETLLSWLNWFTTDTSLFVGVIQSGSIHHARTQ
jgi:hypothetical protein